MSKWKNKFVKTDEGTFHSKKEYNRWCELKLLATGGLIRELKRQVPFELCVGGVLVTKYVADFVYFEAGERVIEDTKGALTPEYKLKSRLMLAVHGIVIRET